MTPLFGRSVRQAYGTRPVFCWKWGFWPSSSAASLTKPSVYAAGTLFSAPYTRGVNANVSPALVAPSESATVPISSV